MNIEWYEQNCHNIIYDRLILVADIGGTNTSVGIMLQRGDNFQLVIKAAFASSSVGSCLDALQQTLEVVYQQLSGLNKPQLCCISAAGPVENNCCHITNLAWDIDGGEIERVLGIKTYIINDFMAISYSLPLLDINNPQQITLLGLTGPTASCSTQLCELAATTIRTVVGAGTGLGVGFLIQQTDNPQTKHKSYIACASEGGHIGFADFDEQTRELKAFVASQLHCTVEAEHLISGPGLVRIFEFLQQRDKQYKAPKALAMASVTEKPALIFKYARDEYADSLCREAVELFVMIYARFASDMAVVTLPNQGLYLAGGIVMKNQEFFVKDNLFRKFFVQHPRENIRTMLEDIPVYIIRDYATSLYGAAHAAVINNE